VSDVRTSDGGSDACGTVLEQIGRERRERRLDDGQICSGLKSIEAVSALVIGCLLTGDRVPVRINQPHKVHANTDEWIACVVPYRSRDRARAAQPNITIDKSFTRTNFNHSGRIRKMMTAKRTIVKS
jgi:hypothetical protein